MLLALAIVGLFVWLRRRFRELGDEDQAEDSDSDEESGSYSLSSARRSALPSSTPIYTLSVSQTDRADPNNSSVSVIGRGGPAPGSSAVPVVPRDGVDQAGEGSSQVADDAVSPPSATQSPPSRRLTRAQAKTTGQVPGGGLK